MVRGLGVHLQFCTTRLQKRARFDRPELVLRHLLKRAGMVGIAGTGSVEAI